MGKIILLTILTLASFNTYGKTKVVGSERKPNQLNENLGTSQTLLQKDNNWIRIVGLSAKALYEALEGPASNNQSEAGENIFFKKGQSYTCWQDKASSDNNAFACTILIDNPTKGILK